MTRLTTLQAKRTTDEALSTLWSLFTRPKPDGGAWGDTAGSQTEEQYRRQLTASPGAMGEVCKAALGIAGITAAESAALEKYILLEAEVALREHCMR